MRTTLRRIGNSIGIIIPRPLLEQAGLPPSPQAEAELTLEDGGLMIRKIDAPVRQGWAEASARIAASGDDALVMGEFPNAGDAEYAW
jgi:antitoxin MazE